MKLIKFIFILLLSVLVFIVFNAWFLSPIISAGDSWYYFQSMFDNHFLRPFAWYEYSVATGLGGQGFAFVTIYTLVAFILEIAKFLNLSWETISRLTLYLPFIFLSLASSIFLVRKLFPKNPFWVIAPIIFTFNTYILMVVGGGQLPTAISYSLIPFSLFLFFMLLGAKEKDRAGSVLLVISSALFFSLQCILDLRIAFVIVVALVIYVLVLAVLRELKIRNLAFLITAFMLIFFINSYWIIPIFLLGIDPIEQLGLTYSSSEMVKFLSFAKFENSFGLMHPYWPDNIFGKIGFMKPEFLILPILAFSSLFFIGKDKKETKFVLFFVLLGLVGAFLGKGASEPFGQIYIWLFEHVPGFQLFRDSFKWYSLIALSYSILIPFTVWKIYELIKPKDKFLNSKFFNLSNGFILIVVLVLLFLIRPAIFDQLGGTFQSRNLPDQYSQLNYYLSKDNEFYRTLWVPNTMLFGYYSNIHPQISARDFFRIYDFDNLVSTISSPSGKLVLKNASVKYIIVPEDTEKEIFLTDRKYDDSKYQSVVSDLDKISWLTKDKVFEKIAVYKTDSFKDHFWCDCDAEITYKFINPTKYKVNVRDARKGDVLVFSESFDPNWVALVGDKSYKSQKFDKYFNSFKLPEGSFEITVYYSLQKYLDAGVIISLISLIISIGILLLIIVKKYIK